MIEYKQIEKIVYLIPARNFYDGLTDSKIARDYQNYIEFQSQKYNQTLQFIPIFPFFSLIDVKRKLLWFGLLRRNKEEMEAECLNLIRRFHLERWV